MVHTGPVENGQHKIRDLQEGDLEYLAANLRSADVLEALFASGSADTFKSLQTSVDASDIVRVGCGDGETPGVIWGAIRAHENGLVIWALGTNDIVKYRKTFMKESKEQLREFFEISPDIENLYNYTYTGNRLHHLWLKHCGAEFLPEITYGKFQQSFYPFYIPRSAICVT